VDGSDAVGSGGGGCGTGPADPAGEGVFSDAEITDVERKVRGVGFRV